MASKFSNYYDTYETLGRGSFGTVMRCVKRATREEFAVKIIEKNVSYESLEEVMHEAKICRKLQHPNIVRLLESFDERDNFYLVFDLVVGGELFVDVQNLKYYSEATASQCMQQILEAVNYCHKRSIVHRDLKAENILLTSKTKPTSIKIADFGLAIEVYGDERDWHGSAGTPLYTAPEIIRREDYGKPIDMWSCGVILYLLLIGDEPFYDENDDGLNRKIVAGVYNYPKRRRDSISSEAKDIVKRMLTLNADKRITASEALKHPWIRQPDVVAPTVHLAETVGHLKKFNARRKFKAAIFAAVAAKKFFKRSSGSSLKKTKQLQDGKSTSEVKHDPVNEERLKQEIVKLTEKLVIACEARDSKTVQKLCETNVTAFDSNGSGDILTGIDFENFFTENIPVEGYRESNTVIVHPRVHLLSNKSACIAYVRSTEYITPGGRLHLQETEETLVWLKRNGQWKIVHLHSGLTYSYK